MYEKEGQKLQKLNFKVAYKLQQAFREAKNKLILQYQLVDQ